MFRKIRRIKNEISVEDAKELLRTNRRAALAVNGDNGYPYTVPINFFYDEPNNKIYFHSAKKGHKIESILENDKVCFTTWNDGYIEEGDWAYRVSSCVVFGRASIVEDRVLAKEKIREFALKYYPSAELVDEVISQSFPAAEMICIDIEHISGKRVYEK